MMGHSQAEKQRTHERIVEIAARRLREKGLEGVGVADLMKEAGLTVGGFYKHFASRDELVAEAMDLAFSSWRRKTEAEGIDPKDVTLDDYVTSYLSTRHRDNPGDGCAFAALSAEIGRADPKTRAIATGRLGTGIDSMAARIGGTDNADARREAIIAVCALAGAVGLARMVDDEALSQEILDTVKAFAVGLSTRR